MSDRPIPCLVVSGFLGSGKTTLVRRLLDEAQATGSRVAFVSNELGELGMAWKHWVISLADTWSTGGFLM